MKIVGSTNKNLETLEVLSKELECLLVYTSLALCEDIQNSEWIKTQNVKWFPLSAD